MSKLALAVVVLVALWWPSPARAASLTLAWDPPVDGVTQGYVLSVGTASQSYSRQIDVGGVTSYTVTGLAPGVTYYFVVRARSAAGLFSPPSGEVSATVPIVPQATPSVGDFNHDDTRDLLFQATTGYLYLWFMSGTSFVGGTWLSPAWIDPVWRVAAARDFTGDGHPDLLVQHGQSGTVKIEPMVGIDRVGEQTIFSATSTPWLVAASGDFNADGHADLLWENVVSGEIYVWLMAPAGGAAGFAGAGGAFSGDYVRDAKQQAVWRTSPTQRVVGVGDVDRDGAPDIIWQDSRTNEVGVWLVRGLEMIAEMPLSPNSVAPAWQIRVVGDYDGDGWPDLVWQHRTTGELYVWFMTGRTLRLGSAFTPSAVNPMWRPVAP